MADDTEQRIFDPTPRRRQQARAQGRVPLSRDLGSAALVLGSCGLLVFAGGAVVEFLAALLRASLSGQAWQEWIDQPSPGDVVARQWQALVPSLSGVLLPLVAGAAGIVAMAHLVQTGFLLRWSRVAPDVARVSPAAGLRRLFSGHQLGQAAFDACKVAAVAGVGFAGLWTRRERLVMLAGRDPAGVAVETWNLCLLAGLEMGATLLVLAAVDYAWQRFRLARELKMTPQEMREEMRELAGQGAALARRRSQQRAAAPFGPTPPVA